jgi:UPF0271 protein
MPEPRAELNIDLGEMPGEPGELYSLAHRVNIACGGHAGDVQTMRRACEAAARAGALPGAHPSFPDREHFGRRPLSLPLDELRATIRSQCAALLAVATSVGVRLAHVKLHGALYHVANADPALADAVLTAAIEVLGPVAIIGPPEGASRRTAEAVHAPYLGEGFADRGYSADGTLLPRGSPGALIEDPTRAAAQAEALLRLGRFDTLCVHSDTPNAVAVARTVRAVLDTRTWT